MKSLSILCWKCDLIVNEVAFLSIKTSPLMTSSKLNEWTEKDWMERIDQKGSYRPKWTEWTEMVHWYGSIIA